ncbi:MAG: FixH family protein [Parvibaculum sp.]|uniref:FixH family protein n=1 Tax=Parvibaculum sp. TaxID=2024848 RepID=UPI0025E8A9D4|nr:FixH family protein [Parvibaculum sp.]MCE9650100.1 FixH family protein [Parvibaculum sp.]
MNIQGNAREDDFVPAGRFGALTGRRFLGLLLAAFALVFSVNGLMIYKAVSTFDGIEVDDAYQRGRAYNQTIDAMAVQAARGWHATVAVTPAAIENPAPHAVRVSVVLTDRAGAALGDLKLHATFWRPVSVGDDRRLALRETAPGHYQGDVQLAVGGSWLLRLAGVGPHGEKFAQEERLLIGN